ncbi:chemotaxis-specific protein-glutamate methyltransferase [Methylophaga lonarensis MPL]|uniref:Protein-glutamate methylesterase/protein-glutamine glutaminase n=1 Tax=Methylophaga lonarensis MPL TaxID=1286106 RepID=M7PN33_9GAMM|nr:chemotaxis response regulator protein-glutamate methylesterase [Methylophaga lonarensis]EMR11869.1 chemotaxis-specific protein-glutamate methyltransferase [Methylophaga lonarensis MPL]
MTVKVLIVDDSAFFRRRLSEIIDADPRMEVIATAANGEEAVSQATRLRPDVITMDMEMPVMDGIAAVRKIMKVRPTPILMISTWTTEGAKATLDALDAGAMDYLPKRFEDLSSDKQAAQKVLRDRIHSVAKGFLAARQPHKTVEVSAAHKMPASSHDVIKQIVIGTSTGGPVALQRILSQLPANFSLPILLVQHMPASFTPSFAERLNAQCAITVKEAKEGDVMQAGVAYLAPGGQQTLFKGRAERLFLNVEAGQATQTYRPCIDMTLSSLARISPANTLAIILTGMGSDGRDGCMELHRLGATVWAQDQASSTIYGMPMAVAKAGIADKILSLDDIGQQLAAMS